MITPGEWNRRGRFLDYRGERIFCIEEGEGPPLLLLHGFPTSSWDWCKIWPVLTKHYRCIAFDMIGFGVSAKPVEYEYSFFDQVDLHEELLLAMGLDSVHVLAHDYGDTVAQEWLARQAEGEARVSLKSVAMLNGGVIYGVHRPRLMQRLLVSPLGRFIGPRMSQRTFNRSFPPIFGAHTQPTAEELDGYWEGIAHNNGPLVVHKLIRYLIERKRHYKRWVPVLGNAPCALQFIAGSDDPISGAHMARAIDALGPERRSVVMEGIGHYPQMEAPDETLRHYFKFRESSCE